LQCIAKESKAIPGMSTRLIPPDQNSFTLGPEPCALCHSLNSETEKRYYALGQTDLKRTLFIAFTVRKKLIRVISVRDMNRKERRIYNNEQENT